MTDQQRVDNLLQPRWEVIADYPGSHLEVGSVFNCEKLNDGKNDFFLYEEDMKLYPHLFRPLPWYLKREIEELPQYLKWDTKQVPEENYDEVIKVNGYRKCNPGGSMAGMIEVKYDAVKDKEIKPTISYLSIHLPATIAQYTEYINAKNK